MAQVDSNKYYPIESGIFWNYENEYWETNEFIVDTLIFNNNVYHGLAINSETPMYWVREENNIVSVFQPDSKEEAIVLNFNLEVGDTISNLGKSIEGNCYWGTMSILESKTDTFFTESKTFYNCYRFSHLSSCADAGLITSWYAKGIGKVGYIEDNIGVPILNRITTNFTTNVEPIPIQSKLNLFQNYPNPFNPITKIVFQLNSLTDVKLYIYNISGELVLKLIDSEIMNSGYYEKTFDATKLSSGVYYALLETKLSKNIIKMLLLK